MFPSQKNLVNVNVQNVDQKKNSYAMHNTLIRSIWNQIQVSVPEDLTSFTSIDVAFSVKLSREDVLILKRYVEHGSGASPESVNEIFSRFLVPITSLNPQETKFEFSLNYAISLVPFIVYLIYRKFGVILLTTFTILSVASYELYIKAVAKRHALINRLPSVPDECLPYSQQSIMTKVRNYLPFVNPQDDCARYFELQMKPVYADLRPDRILLLVLEDVVNGVGSALGGGLGGFYSSLNNYVPFVIAFPIFCLVFVSFVYSLPRFICGMSKGSRKPRKKRALSKSKPLPALKDE